MPTVWYSMRCLPVNLKTETLVKKATEASVADREEVLIAIPQSIGILQDAVVELARLRWVEDHTLPNLMGMQRRNANSRRELRRQNKPYPISCHPSSVQTSLCRTKENVLGIMPEIQYRLPQGES